MKDATNHPHQHHRQPPQPAKPEALTPAQRAKAYRQRLKANGMTAVKCYLPPEAMAYLGALCDIHHVTISEAVALAVAQALRGDPLPPVN